MAEDLRSSQGGSCQHNVFREKLSVGTHVWFPLHSKRSPVHIIWKNGRILDLTTFPGYAVLKQLKHLGKLSLDFYLYPVSSLVVCPCFSKRYSTSNTSFLKIFCQETSPYRATRLSPDFFKLFCNVSNVLCRPHDSSFVHDLQVALFEAAELLSQFITSEGRNVFVHMTPQVILSLHGEGRPLTGPTLSSASRLKLCETSQLSQSLRRVLCSLDLKETGHKAIALVLLGAQESGISRCVMTVLDSLTISNLFQSDRRKSYYSIAFLLTLLTQTSSFSNYAGFHYEFKVSQRYRTDLTCSVTLWCEALLLCLCRYQEQHSPPLVYQILAVSFLYGNQNPSVQLSFTNLKKDAAWILNMLFPSLDLENARSTCCMMYDNLVRCFVDCGFNFSTIRDILHIFFVISFCDAGSIYFSKNRVEKSIPHKTQDISLHEYIKQVLQYMDIQLSSDSLKILGVPWLHFLPFVCYNLYSGVLHFIISSFNTREAKRLRKRDGGFYSIHVIHGMGEFVNDMTQVSTERLFMLNDYLRRCAEDTLRAFYDLDISFPELLIDPKRVEDFQVKGYEVIHHESVIFKYLKTVHERFTEQDLFFSCSLNKFLSLSKKDRHKLYSECSHFRQRVKQKLSKQLSRYIALKRIPSTTLTYSASCFEFSHLHLKANYTLEEFYDENGSFRLPFFLIQLLKLSSYGFIKKIIVDSCLANRNSLHSCLHQKHLNRITKILSESAQRFYIVCLGFTKDQQEIIKRSLDSTNKINELLSATTSLSCSGPISPLIFKLLGCLVTQLFYYSIPECERCFTFIPFSYVEFVERYANLFCIHWRCARPEELPNDAVLWTQNALQAMGVSIFPHRFLKKVFFLPRSIVEYLNTRLEELIYRISPACIFLQRRAKMIAARSQRKKAIEAIIFMQSCLRRIVFIEETEQHLRTTKTSSLFASLIFFLSNIVTQDEKLLARKNAFSVIQMRNSTSYDNKKHRAAVRIQSWWRMICCIKQANMERYTLALRFAALQIQTACRRYLAQLHVCYLLVHKKQVDSAVMIQKCVRSWLKRRNFLEMVLLRMAIVPIKRLTLRPILFKHRVHMLALLKKNNFERALLKEAWRLSFFATVIQKHWKGHFVRSQYSILHQTAKQCQVFALTHLHQWHHHQRIQKILFLQRWWRAYLKLQPFSRFFQSIAHPDSTLSLRVLSPEAKNLKIQQKKSFCEKEYKSFRLGFVPLLFYQAIFYRFGKGKIHPRCCFLPLHFHIQNIHTNVYPRTWACSFLRLLHHYAWKSWNARLERLSSLDTFSWPTLFFSCVSHLRALKINLAQFLPHTYTLFSLFSQLPPFLCVQSISLGGYHTLLLLGFVERPQNCVKQNVRQIEVPLTYRVFSWGLNDRGQLGVSSVTSLFKDLESSCTLLTPLAFHALQYDKGVCPVTGHWVDTITQSIDYSTSIRWIGAGDNFSTALTDDGLLFTWGDNQYGQCGHGFKYSCIREPKLIEALKEFSIQSIAVGPCHVVCVTLEHTAFLWGKREHIALEDLCLGEHIYTPIRFPIEKWCQDFCCKVVCGRTFNVMTLMRRPASLLLWGNNEGAQLGLSDTESLQEKIQRVSCVDLVKDPSCTLFITSISCGSDFVVACVQPCEARIFLWGVFAFFQPRQTFSLGTGLGSSISRFLNPGSSTSHSRASHRQPTKKSFNLCRIHTPTPVTDPLWNSAERIHAVCGHTSCVTVALDTNEIYGFSFVQALESSEPSSSSVPSSVQPTVTSNSALLLDETRRERLEPFYPQQLQSPLSLAPALYQYRTWRHEIFFLEQLHCTFNSRGAHLCFASSSLSHLRSANLKERWNHQCTPHDTAQTSYETTNESFGSQSLQVSTSHTRDVISRQPIFSLEENVMASGIRLQDHHSLHVPPIRKDKLVKENVSVLSDYIQNSLTTDMQSQALALGEAFLGPVNV